MRNFVSNQLDNQPWTTSHLLQCIVLFLVAGNLMGCASVFDSSASKNKSKDKKKEGWSLFKKKEYQEPRSLVSTWTEDVLIQPGKPTTRGFGGRFYFYNDRSQVIPVDGELVVYGFEDATVPATAQSGNLPPNSVAYASPSPSDSPVVEADKKFRFTAEQFTQHFSQGDLGASYSVWIPWDAAGGPQRKITLIPCFITKDGRTVRGDASKQVLSGKPAVVASTKNPGNPIQLASLSQSPGLSTNVQQASMTSISPTSMQPYGNGQVVSASNQSAPSNMAPGMQPLGLNTTTIRLGHSSSLSNSMTSQNRGFNNTAATPIEMNAPGMSNPGLGFPNNNQGIQMPAGYQTQPVGMPMNSSMPNSGIEAVPSKLNPQPNSTGAFHNPLNQTTLPSLGHNLPPTGWMKH
jgi:hypothetical protein